MSWFRKPSRYGRVAPARREWAPRQVPRLTWQRLVVVLGFGVILCGALWAAMTGPFWIQLTGWVLSFVLGVVVIGRTDDGRTWTRPLVALVLFAPMFAVVISMDGIGLAFDSAGPARETAAEWVGWIPVVKGYFCLYEHTVANERHKLLMLRDRGCPQRLPIEYVVEKPWRLRERQYTTESPPPPAPPPLP